MIDIRTLEPKRICYMAYQKSVGGGSAALSKLRCGDEAYKLYLRAGGDQEEEDTRAPEVVLEAGKTEGDSGVAT